jgi:hypothetical protein
MPRVKFFLRIGKDRFDFNRDVNTCSAKAIVTGTTIEFNSEYCTRACCDGRFDPIGGMKLYSGNYMVIDTALVIWNENAKTYLERVAKEE